MRLFSSVDKLDAITLIFETSWYGERPPTTIFAFLFVYWWTDKHVKDEKRQVSFGAHWSDGRTGTKYPISDPQETTVDGDMSNRPRQDLNPIYKEAVGPSRWVTEYLIIVKRYTPPARA
jgi:hypothetical protein